MICIVTIVSIHYYSVLSLSEYIKNKPTQTEVIFTEVLFSGLSFIKIYYKNIAINLEDAYLDVSTSSLLKKKFIK